MHLAVSALFAMPAPHPHSSTHSTPLLASARVALLEAVRAEAARLKAQRAQLKERAAALIPPGARVMTTSYSSTVLVALAAAAADGRLGAVVCCESRPLCEGVALARALAAAGARDVTVITDAQAAAFLGSVDLVLLGADALSEAGAVNKVGSRLIALAAREEGVPVYACCDSGKISIGGPVEQLVGLGLGSGGGGGGSIASSGGGVVGSTGVAGGRNQGGVEEHEEKGEDEVTQGWPAQLRAAAAVGGGVTGGGKGAGGGGGIEVRNVYFEAVPLPLLTGGVVTDQGVVAEDDIRAAVASRRRQYLRAFDLATLEHPPRPDVKSGGLGVA
jgi:translation initiation factor 2B subunit (eIF-2B alpha/beta/delta family)